RSNLGAGPGRHAEGPTAGQSHDRRPFVRRETPVDERGQFINSWILRRIRPCANGIAERLLVRRFPAGRHVVSRQLLDRSLLLYIVETKTATVESRERVVGTLLTFRSIRELALRAGCRQV